LKKLLFFEVWLNSICRGRIGKCLYASVSRIKAFVGACVPLEIEVSPTGDPNPKWISKRIPIASNIVPI
jgi:hypothetical protein